MADRRTYQVNPKGLAIFAKYAHHLQEAERGGESPPRPDADPEVIAGWLAEHGKLEGIPKEQAAFLIELVGVYGGRASADLETEEGWVTADPPEIEPSNGDRP
jgi:hypothetical protein